MLDSDAPSSLPGSRAPDEPAERDNAVSLYYRDAHRRSGLVLDETLHCDSFSQLCECHSHIDDLQKWNDALVGYRELVVLRLAKTEFELALLAIMRGDYRSAFIRLRLHIELVCLAIYGSANRVDLEDWLGGIQDVSWTRLVDESLGVLAVRFCRSFAPALADDVKHFRSIAVALYRECSEFVHGNRRPSEPALPPAIEFASPIVQLWATKARSAMLLVTFVLTMRYLQELQPATARSLHDPICDRLGHLRPVRDYFASLNGGI